MRRIQNPVSSEVRVRVSPSAPVLINIDLIDDDMDVLILWAQDAQEQCDMQNVLTPLKTSIQEWPHRFQKPVCSKDGFEDWNRFLAKLNLKPPTGCSGMYLFELINI